MTLKLHHSIAALLCVFGASVVHPHAAEPYRASYYKDGEIHITVLGEPEGKPITTGHWDFKPSWSKTGDHLVFFRRLKNDPVVSNWITQLCIINADGSGFHPLSDGTHTDFNPTWTRDGKNTPVWNRKNTGKGGYTIMASKIGGKPGEEIALTDPNAHAWVHSAVRDGRLFVSAIPPKLGYGLYLMTPDVKQTLLSVPDVEKADKSVRPTPEPKFERITCDLAQTGSLDRISISPDETKICFDYHPGKENPMPGRTLYVADFDVKARTITNAKPFANEERKKVWFDYPRWTQDGKAIVYMAGGKLFLQTLADGSTKQVSTDAKADYRYPHGEATPN